MMINNKYQQQQVGTATRNLWKQFCFSGTAVHLALCAHGAALETIFKDLSYGGS